MKILVTGGAGFIGSHLVDALVARGDRVVVVDDLSKGRERNLNRAAGFHRVDIRDAVALEKVFAEETPEVISHHAAQTDVRRSMSDPAFDAHVNILGFVNLLHLGHTFGVAKVVFASSAAVYPTPERVPVDESYPARSFSSYGLTKRVGELYLQLYREAYGLRFTAFRYGNVYGPRQDAKGEAGVVAIFSEQMLRGVQPTLFGDGTKTRDYIHVSDVVHGNLLAIDGRADGEILNLGWGVEVTDYQVFAAVRDAVGVDVQPRYDKKRPGEVDRISLDSARATRLLGWSPKVDFASGIRATVDSYRTG